MSHTVVRAGRAWSVIATGAMLFSLLAGALPAAAATGVPTKLVARAAPATARIGSTVLVSGSVSPKAGAPVTVQRLVGKSWHAVATGKVASAGTFSVSVKTPGTAGKWLLRVTRAATGTAKAGVSAVLTVRVVKTAFVVKVTAAAPSVSAGSPVVLTGSVRPKATGSVQVQRLVGKTWVASGTAKLSATSTFTYSSVRPVGAYRLRVVKPFNATVAGGVSAGLSVVVITPAPTGPTVSTTALPAATAGVAYSATLTASGGTAPYLWTSAGLPAAVAMTTAGVVQGVPAAAGSYPVTVVVVDATGHSAATVLTMTVGAAPRPSGHVWAWGHNTSGQLGNNTTTDSTVLVPVSGLPSVVQVAGMSSSGLALKSDGTVWAWGNNNAGQLGNNSTTNSSVPVQVSGLTGIIAVAGGASTGYALRADGTVVSWGYDLDGELGNGVFSGAGSLVPVPVSNLTGVTAIASGGFSAYALRGDGTVWSWGVNSVGQLGNNSSAASNVPVMVSGLTGVTAIAAGTNDGYAVRADGTAWAWGYGGLGGLGNAGTSNSPVPVQVSGLTSVTALAAGGASCYALRTDHTVWAWGSNGQSQLGYGPGPSTLVAVQVSGLTDAAMIAAGNANGYAARLGGNVAAWGEGSHGELGNGTSTSSNVPVQTSALTNVIGIASNGYGQSAYAITLG